MKVAGLIVAAGLSSRMKDFKPMMKIGNQTIIKRVILTLKEAGANPIVVITGFKADELEESLKDIDVICLRNDKYATTQMFDSVKIGLEYLKDRCDTVLFTPGDIPLFSLESVRQLLKSGEKLAKPVCNGRGGHPLLIDSSFIDSILACNKDGGLKAALQELDLCVKKIEVRDKGVLLDADTKQDFENLVSFYQSKNFREL
jgi:CTP:molybdopterin cytidylyltransferase MocA